MHGVDIEQIADYDLRTDVAQRPRTFVIGSHHRTHGLTFFQQHLGDCAAYAANTARGAGYQNGM
jgi:hypothetical protein